MVSASVTGNTYGLAWARNSRTLYSAAFYKRGVDYGPSGSGAIYKLTGAGTPGSAGSLFVDLNSIFPGAAGTETHSFTTVPFQGSSCCY